MFLCQLPYNHKRAQCFQIPNMFHEQNRLCSNRKFPEDYEMLPKNRTKGEPNVNVR